MYNFYLCCMYSDNSYHASYNFRISLYILSLCMPKYLIYKKGTNVSLNEIKKLVKNKNIDMEKYVLVKN